MSWAKWQGKILKRLGKIAISLACCCSVPCCARTEPPGDVPEHLPETLQMVITNTGDCPCIDATTLTLTWHVINRQYEVSGPGGGGCAIRSDNWRLSCTNFGGGVPANPDPNATDCMHWQLSIEEVTACIMIGDPFFALTGCSCYPLHLEFDLAFAGINCCDSFTGEGSIHVVIDEI